MNGNRVNDVKTLACKTSQAGYVLIFMRSFNLCLGQLVLPDTITAIDDEFLYNIALKSVT